MSHISAEYAASHLDHPEPSLVPAPRSAPTAARRPPTALPRRLLVPLLAGLLGLLAAACSRAPEPIRARSLASRIAEKWPRFTRKANQSEERRRFKDAPVYIDGKRVGVIRPLEVPSSLKPRMRTRPGATPAPRYSIAEYIDAVGGDLAKVRQLHLYGGRGRISVIAGDELRKHKEDLFFLFTAGTRGKPRIGWPLNGIESNGSIDLVQAAVVYQEREPPTYDGKKGTLFFADHKPIDGIPYAPAEEVKGTRFYADGVLAGWMKRKILPSSILLPGAAADSGLFSLRAFIESLGVDPRKVKVIELVQDDDAVARLDGAALTKDPPLTFKLPRRNQGNLVLLLPVSLFPAAPADAPATVPVRISAVQLFLRLAPPKRTYATLDQVVEKEGDRKDPGSNNAQGDSEN